MTQTKGDITRMAVARPGEGAKQAADRIAATWKALHPIPPIPVPTDQPGYQFIVAELELLGLTPVLV